MKTILVGLASLASLLVASLNPAEVQAQEYPADQVAGPEYQDPNAYQDPNTYQDPSVGYAPQQSSFGYYGSHPVPHDQGGGFCGQQGAHEHAYPVFDQHLFRFSNGYAYFVGDPGDFGYQSTAYLYSGHHPFDDAYGGGYCYMGWGHRHLFAPVGVNFVLQGGSYVYNGGWAPSYYSQRSLYTNYFDGYYRRNYWGNRYYSVRPQHSYVGWGWRRPYAPAYRAPVYRAPGYGGPVYRAPMQAPPVYRAPGYGGGPVYRAPMQAPPVYRAPAYQAPAYRAPVYQAPAYRAPVQAAPVYRAPMHQAPAYRAPVVAPPAYRGPVNHAGWGRR